MKTLTLYFYLILGLSACNEGSREITDSSEQSTITETRYESTVNQTLDEAELPDYGAPNFRFRDSFTASSPEEVAATDAGTNTVNAAPPSSTTSVVETEPTVVPNTEENTSTTQTEKPKDQQTAHVVNLPKNDTLNVRKRAGTTNPILEKLAPNSKVTITGESKTTKDGQEWFEIITQNKNTGWVNNHYLKLNK